jgi:hypothetical protein
VLQARERASTPYFSIVFFLGLTFESLKELGARQAITKKQVGYIIPEVRTTDVVIDNYMVVIQVEIGKNTIEDVLLDGGFGINIITK